jgi:hypothetical protein
MSPIDVISGSCYRPRRRPRRTPPVQRGPTSLPRLDARKAPENKAASNLDNLDNLNPHARTRMRPRIGKSPAHSYAPHVYIMLSMLATLDAALFSGPFRASNLTTEVGPRWTGGEAP